MMLCFARYGFASRARAGLCLCALLCLACAVQGEQTAYRLGPEDVINVAVARHPEFSGEFYIPVDGVVNLPAAGQVSATGKTLAELSEAVKTQLGDRLREPEVTVTLKTARQQRVYVMGSVDKPGPYDAKPGWRVTEAIAAAGGVAKTVESTDCQVALLRASTGKRETTPLADVLHGKPEQNPLVESGDVVMVEAEETMPVYVMGRVKNPGMYRLRKGNARVVEALTLAGGTLEDAALDRVSISHLSGKSETVDLVPAVLDGTKSAATTVEAGDLITVPAETGRVAVLGYVNEPGYFPVRSGQTMTLSDVLGLAKGVDNRRGQMGAVAVVRKSGTKEQQNQIYDFRKFLKSGDLTQNPEIHAGDVVYVPQNGKPDWGSVFQALTSIGIFASPIL